ncbi:MAG: LysR family transcriptional regulator [Pseudomonadales bacterium]|nr:LysR family transcriptional regulator [Pseudomonadales bacterium]
MHIHKSDLSLLLVFHAIYQEGSLTRAADVLHLTQPAVSHALARLRLRLSDPLFTRQGQRMIPSAMARQMAMPVAQAIASLESVWLHDAEFQPGHAEIEFRLGMRDVLEAHVLPGLMRILRSSAPGIQLSSVRVERRHLASMLSSGQLDIAVDVYLPVSEGLRSCRLTREALAVVVGPWFTDHRDLSLEDYLQGNHILVSSRRQGLGLEDLELQRLGLSRHIALRCQHYYAACQVVAQTNLLLTMPQSYARLLIKDSSNIIRPLPVSMPSMDIYIYWHSRREDEPAHRWLRQQLMKVADQP